ncbi:hypothetical protein [Microtetraspora malaysiensis]|uniref:hypothetical protein n=1 Tax=Microtetraspora malaysiensis TaxID=161358 RepID=UPI0012FA3F86|nr:hypothetical protein [Microtetraspora malaysiensis]
MRSRRAPPRRLGLLAYPPGEAFHLGTDDVMVVFTAEFAAKVGIPGIPGIR